MNYELKEAKQGIRAFWPNYSDERLAWLLAHARSGNLSFYSCCCFIGVATADHALRSSGEPHTGSEHLSVAHAMLAADDAETAFCTLAARFSSCGGNSDDEQRRRRIIPMIKAEMRRRERERDIQVATSASARTQQVS